MDRLLLVYVADWHRKRQKVHPFKKVKNVYADEITVHVCLIGTSKEYTYVMSTQLMHCVFNLRQDYFYVLYPLSIFQCSGTSFNVKAQTSEKMSVDDLHVLSKFLVLAVVYIEII